MPRNMPARATPPLIVCDRPASRQEPQAVAARREAENGLLVHTLRAHFDEEAARIDAETVASASQSALSVELDVLSWGIAKANGSPAAAKLVADRVEQLSRINTKNIGRRFGS
jgi:hypothetical protein